MEVVIAGYQRKTRSSPQGREIVAYHEIGHALVAAKQSDKRPCPQKSPSSPHLRRAGLHHAGGRRGKFLMSGREAYSKLATLTGDTRG